MDHPTWGSNYPYGKLFSLQALHRITIFFMSHHTRCTTLQVRNPLSVLSQANSYMISLHFHHTAVKMCISCSKHRAQLWGTVPAGSHAPPSQWAATLNNQKLRAPSSRPSLQRQQKNRCVCVVAVCFVFFSAVSNQRICSTTEKV